MNASRGRYRSERLDLAWRLVILAFWLLCLSGCAVKRDTSARVRLDRGAKIDLSTFEGFGEPFAGLQRMVIQPNSGDPFRMQLAVEVEGDRHALVGLTPIGNRAFSIVLEEGRLRYEALPFFRLPVPARELLGCWVLAHYPEEALRAEALSAKWTLETLAEEGRELRRFADRHGVVLEIRIQGDPPERSRVRVIHYRKGYRIDFTSR
ncbi:DUF3261 domain-containing protein [Sulfidibacter corallicola]|uniref:DUF3261 domain-containing protein n=1 Tax=Sulfidibacter corallicola TaxID=2818388 RepID=A0A8A4THR5_SULCO|nr:DUF3261 domain-containing protein [Sulfidibacter corallicola]QTD49173.1 DUF3261 domain-containing protein [Sulfidibacter corallicola]